MAVLAVIIIAVLIIFGPKSKTPPPRIVNPNWTDPDRQKEFRQEQERKRKVDDYWSNHYFSVDLNCFVKERRSGTFVKSIPYVDWIDGCPDDTGEIVTPDILLNHDEYNLWLQCDSYNEYYYKRYGEFL